MTTDKLLPWNCVIGMDAIVIRPDGSRINFGDAIYHPENAKEALAYVDRMNRRQPQPSGDEALRESGASRPSGPGEVCPNNCVDGWIHKYYERDEINEPSPIPCPWPGHQMKETHEN